MEGDIEEGGELRDYKAWTVFEHAGLSRLVLDQVWIPYETI